MPVYAADVLPDTTGRNLGSPSQRWNIFANNVDSGGSSGVIYAATSPSTTNLNTTAAQPLTQCPIPTGSLNAAGKVLRASMGGIYTTQSGQTPYLSFAAYIGPVPWGIGGIDIFSVATGAFLAGVQNVPWRIQFEFTVQIPGSSAQIVPSGVMFAMEAIGSSACQTYFFGALPSGPVDLTIAQNIFTEIAFSTNTSPANSITQYTFIVEVLN